MKFLFIHWHWSIFIVQAKKEQDQGDKLRLMDEMKELLSKYDSFDDQLDKFLDKIQISNEDIQRKFEKVVEDLRVTLSQSFPECKLSMFGSVLTRLGLRGVCDLDVSLSTGNIGLAK